MIYNCGDSEFTPHQHKYKSLFIEPLPCSANHNVSNAKNHRFARGIFDILEACMPTCLEAYVRYGYPEATALYPDSEMPLAVLQHF